MRRFLSWLFDISMLRIIALLVAIATAVNFWGHWLVVGIAVGVFTGTLPDARRRLF